MFVVGPGIVTSLAATALSKVSPVLVAKMNAIAADPLAAAPVKSAKDEFRDYAKLTPAQKMRAAMLGEMGLTEEQLKAMDPKARQQIEDQIKQRIKAEIENDPKLKPGFLVDVKA